MENAVISRQGRHNEHLRCERLPDIDEFNVIACHGDLVYETLKPIKELVDIILADRNGHIRYLILDLSDLESLQTDGTMDLILAQNTYRKHGGDIALVITKASIRKPIEILGFDKIFTICTSVEEAIKLLRK